MPKPIRIEQRVPLVDSSLQWSKGELQGEFNYKLYLHVFHFLNDNYKIRPQGLQVGSAARFMQETIQLTEAICPQGQGDKET